MAKNTAQPAAPSPASQFGDEKSKGRNAARTTLESLAGRDLTKLNAGEQSALLVAVCQLLGLADDNNKLIG